jgi:hypothetical protein
MDNAVLAATVLVLAALGAIVVARGRHWGLERTLLIVLLSTGVALLWALALYEWREMVVGQAFRRGGADYHVAIRDMRQWRILSAWTARGALAIATVAAVLGTFRGVKWMVPVLIVLGLVWVVILVFVISGGMPRVL